MFRISSFIILFTLLIGVTQSSAQGNINQEVVTIGVRDLKLKEAFKKPYLPEIIDTVIPKGVIKYTIIPATYENNYIPEALPPARLKVVEPLSKLYNGYIKGGIGTFTTPYAELYLNSIRNRDGNYGLRAKHMSSKGGISDVVSSAYSDNEVELWGKRFFNKHALTAGVFVKRNVLHYYGYPDSLNEILSKDDIMQRYVRAGGSMALQSYYTNVDKWNYNIDLGFKRITDFYNAEENNVNFETKWRRNLKKEVFRLRLGVNHNDYKAINPLDSNNRSLQVQNTIINLSTGIVAGNDKFKLTAELGGFAEIEGSVTKFQFVPNILFQYNLVDQVLVPYLGLTGGIQRNNFNSLSAENNFVQSFLNLKNTKEKIRYFGGFRGNFSSEISFNLFAEYSILDNFVYFIADTMASEEYKFKAVYDKLNRLSVGGELSYQMTNQVRILAAGTYFGYTTDKEEQAWNQPSFKASLATEVNLRNKIYTNLELFLLTNRSTRRDLQDVETQQAEIIELGSLFDINLNVEYRYTKRLSFFLDFTNLTANKYKKWQNYRVQGLGAMIGANFKF